MKIPMILKLFWKNRSMDKNSNSLDRVGAGMGKIHHISSFSEIDRGRAFNTDLRHITKVYENK